MKPVLDLFGAMALIPFVFSQAAFGHLLQWQREQAEAAVKLFASLTGQEGLGAGALRRHPEDADLYPGKTVSHTKTLTDLQTLCFGLLSLDFNPLHFNEALARRTRFGARIAHGFHTASLFSGVLAELTPWCVYLSQEMEFTAPVRAGDAVTATGTIEVVDARGVVRVSLTCAKQDGQVVVRGKALVKKLKEIYHPETARA